MNSLRTLLLLTVLFLCGAAPPLCAQLRVENEAPEKGAPYSVFPLGQMGVIVVRSGAIIFYDENLSLRWTAGFSAEQNYRCLNYRFIDDSLHFAFYNKEKFIHLWVSLATGTGRAKYANISYAALSEKDNIEGVQIYKDRWLLLVSDKNKNKHKFITYCYNSDTSLVKDIPLPNDYVCSNVVFDTAWSNVYAVFRSENFKDDALQLAVSDTSLKEISVNKISSGRNDVRFLEGDVKVLSSNKIIIAGIWNFNRERQDVSAYDDGTQSAGIYAVERNDSIANIMFIKSYIEFPNLGSLSSERLSSSFVRSRKNNAPTLLTQVRIASLSESDFAVVAEVYQRKFSTTTEMYYDVYGRMIPYTRTTYEGVFFTDVFCSVFERVGSGGVGGGVGGSGSGGVGESGVSGSGSGGSGGGSGSGGVGGSGSVGGVGGGVGGNGGGGSVGESGGISVGGGVGGSGSGDRSGSVGGGVGRSGSDGFSGGRGENGGSFWRVSNYVFNVNSDNILYEPSPYSAFAYDSFGNILYAFPNEGRVYYRALPSVAGTVGMSLTDLDSTAGMGLTGVADTMGVNLTNLDSTAGTVGMSPTDLDSMAGTMSVNLSDITVAASSGLAGAGSTSAADTAGVNVDISHVVFLQDVMGGRLTPLHSGDKVQKNWNNRIIHWYNGGFLAYGYQQILNHKVSRTPRSVFYLNKLLMDWK
jgi:hypothetical protein